MPSWNLRVYGFGELFRLTDSYKASRSENPAPEPIRRGEWDPTHAERLNPRDVIGSKRAVSPNPVNLRTNPSIRQSINSDRSLYFGKPTFRGEAGVTHDDDRSQP